MYILIVDDEPIVRTALISRVERLGHTAKAVSDGEEALAVMRAEKPGLVILDMVLDRGLSGWETAKVKQDDPGIRDIPLIVMSALPPEEVRAGRYAHGVFSYPLAGAVLLLTKPVDSASLGRAITAIVLASKG